MSQKAPKTGKSIKYCGVEGVEPCELRESESDGDADADAMQRGPGAFISSQRHNPPRTPVAEEISLAIGFFVSRALDLSNLRLRDGVTTSSKATMVFTSVR